MMDFAEEVYAELMDHEEAQSDFFPTEPEFDVTSQGTIYESLYIRGKKSDFEPRGFHFMHLALASVVNMSIGSYEEKFSISYTIPNKDIQLKETAKEFAALILTDFLKIPEVLKSVHLQFEEAKPFLRKYLEDKFAESDWEEYPDQRMEGGNYLQFLRLQRRPWKQDAEPIENVSTELGSLFMCPVFSDEISMYLGLSKDFDTVLYRHHFDPRTNIYSGKCILKLGEFLNSNDKYGLFYDLMNGLTTEAVRKYKPTQKNG